LLFSPLWLLLLNRARSSISLPDDVVSAESEYCHPSAATQNIYDSAIILCSGVVEEECGKRRPPKHFVATPFPQFRCSVPPSRLAKKCKDMVSWFSGKSLKLLPPD